jgi:PAS domain S-box-containing protein
MKSPLLFNMVFQNSESTSFLILDCSGNIQEVNTGFQTSFGYSRESLIGKNYALLFIEEDINKKLPEKELKKVMETGSANDNNYLLHEDGSPIWVHGESIYAKDENGREYIVKIIQDINEEKILEQKLKEKNEEQERTIKDNETFIYTTSHDLSSPVKNIEALIDTLEESSDDPGEVRFLVPLIKGSVKRLRKKIFELSETGKDYEAKKKNGTAEFQKIYNDVLLDLNEEIKRAEAEISSDFSQAPTIRFPKKNLKSILQNLLSNSIKYRSPTRRLFVTVKTEKVEKDFILMEVQDNGLGIEQKSKDKIFGMYQRLHTHIPGTGVGLGIVKRIV